MSIVITPAPVPLAGPNCPNVSPSAHLFALALKSSIRVVKNRKFVMMVTGARADTMSETNFVQCAPRAATWLDAGRGCAHRPSGPMSATIGLALIVEATSAPQPPERLPRRHVRVEACSREQSIEHPLRTGDISSQCGSNRLRFNIRTSIANMQGHPTSPLNVMSCWFPNYCILNVSSCLAVDRRAARGSLWRGLLGVREGRRC